jgi:SAM-dependent methyltransferase
MATGTLSSSAALAAFIEPSIESRRVLVFGSALGTTPRLLLERGARLVHVCDPAPLRVAEAAERAAAPGLSFSGFSDETLAGREGSFDCVLVENLGAFDARTVVARARRMLSPRGIALFVTPNRDAVAPLLPAPEPPGAPLDYYALYDLVAAEFEHVRMLGQAPFVGYAVVDFAPDTAPEPLIDSEFIPRGSEEPELFVALASRHRVGLGGYAVVQLPLHRVLPHSVVSAPAALPEPPAALPEPSAASLELTRKLKQQESWIVELEARAETADLRADEAEEELERLREELERERAERAERARIVAPPPVAVAPPEPVVGAPAKPPAWLEERRELTNDLERARARARELETKLGERDAARAVLESAIAERDARIEELTRTPPPEDATGDVDELERRLVERGQELRRLEHALVRSEELGRELIADLGRVKTGESDHGELAREVTALADRLAKSEADRLALAWAAAAARTS